MEILAALRASCPGEEEAVLGPWRVRRGRAGGRRASSASLEGPLGDPGPAEAAMRAWGEAPLFAVPEDAADLDALLAARGYRAEGATALYAGPSAALAFRRADVAVIGCAGPIAILAEIWAGAGIGPVRRAVMERVAAPKTYLLGRLDDRPAGAAFVSCAGGVAILNALVVLPAARRRGLGRRLVQAAAAFAVEAGAGTLALAVERGNAPARALYAALGMAEAGGYHYRSLPD